MVSAPQPDPHPSANRLQLSPVRGSGTWIVPAAMALTGLMALVLLAMASLGGCNGSGGSQLPLPGPPPVPVVLPPEFASRAAGFDVELVLASTNTPVKLALSPDGRLFFNELETGDVRVIDVNGDLDPTPFAHLGVITGGERGLLGLALSPGFASDHFVFVMACIGSPDRQQIVRFTDQGGVGANPTVIVDNLPISSVHNSGDLQFMKDGTLIVSVGDVGNTANAQSDGTLAGKILRYHPDGSIPIDNPDANDPEFARGLRNTFDMTVHPVTGGIFATENGPTFDDELNFIAAGKNYEWPSLPGGVPGSQVGLRLHLWPDVIAPTGLVFHDGSGFGQSYRNDLFLGSYAFAQILHLPMSGSQHTDVDDEIVFAQLDNTTSAHKPIDLLVAPDGSLYFSTFTAIWRIFPASQ